MKKSKIYYIRWFDAQSDDAWLLFVNKNKIDEMIIESVGYYIDETKNYIRLALSIGSNKSGCNPQFSGTMSIPKVSIIKMKRLK